MYVPNSKKADGNLIKYMWPIQHGGVFKLVSAQLYNRATCIMGSLSLQISWSAFPPHSVPFAYDDTGLRIILPLPYKSIVSPLPRRFISFALSPRCLARTLLLHCLTVPRRKIPSPLLRRILSPQCPIGALFSLPLHCYKLFNIRL